MLGKLATHSLQAAYAWLAGIAVFFLPVLMGGVLWAEVARLLLILLGTMLLSLACGLFWSTLCVEARTTVLATVGSMLLLVFLPVYGSNALSLILGPLLLESEALVRAMVRL